MNSFFLLVRVGSLFNCLRYMLLSRLGVDVIEGLMLVVENQASFRI